MQGVIVSLDQKMMYDRWKRDIVCVSCRVYDAVTMTMSMTLCVCWWQDGGSFARRGTGDPSGGGRPDGGRASAQAGVWRVARKAGALAPRDRAARARRLSVVIFAVLVLRRWFWSLPITTQASIGVGRSKVHYIVTLFDLMCDAVQLCSTVAPHTLRTFATLAF